MKPEITTAKRALFYNWKNITLDNTLTVSDQCRTSNNGSNNTTIIEDVDLNGNVLNRPGRYQDETEEDNSSQFTANFTKKFDEKGHELVIEFQSEESKEDESDFADNTNVFDQTSSTEEKQNDNYFNGDYVYPIDENTQFEAGFRNYSQQDTDYQVFDINGNVSTLNIITIIWVHPKWNAVYTQYGKKSSFLFAREKNGEY